MMEDPFNMSMCKFLKQVGVTSQQRIDQTLRAAEPTGPVKVRAVITLPEFGMEHVIEGEISTGEAA